MQVQKGQVVRATAGKEQNGFYLVTALEGSSVFLADGKRRPLERPKRKNLRHVAPTLTIWETDGLTDRELRRRLHDFADKGGK